MDYPDWIYYPNVFSNINYESLYNDLFPLMAENIIKVYGKETIIQRLSCKFSDSNFDPSYFSYNNTSVHLWEKVPIINLIKKGLEETFKIKPFDYCLAHIYPDGNASISWHNDKEALDSLVLSISFGATRKFRFRKIGETKGWDKEYLLNHGDIIIMKNGCQRKWIHCVPKEKTVKTSRINLTFRYYN